MYLSVCLLSISLSISLPIRLSVYLPSQLHIYIYIYVKFMNVCLSVCMYVCMYLCMYTHTHTQISILYYVCMCTYISKFTRTCILRVTHTHTHADTHAGIISRVEVPSIQIQSELGGALPALVRFVSRRVRTSEDVIGGDIW